jgi:hypothetical protein
LLDWIISNLPPVLLRSGATHVAIRTADVALLDLSHHQVPWLARSDEADVSPLRRRIAMIEIERDRIRLPAVDAWVHQEVGEHQRTVRDAISVDSRDFAADVLLTIRQVVRASIRGLALPAVPLSCPLGHVRECEVRLGLTQAAHEAGDHGRLRGTAANTTGRPLEHMF